MERERIRLLALYLFIIFLIYPDLSGKLKNTRAGLRVY